MKIKRQFFLLALSIISIPLLCALYILIDGYLKSQDRVLIKGYKEIHKLENNLFSQSEWDELYDTINSLPPDVECSFLSPDFKVILSSIKELPKDAIVTQIDLWYILKTTSNDYYYQFTDAPINDQHLMMISRVSRNKQWNSRKRGNLVSSLMLFLFVIIALLFFYVILIFFSISRSITSLKDKTKEISEGKLDEKITNSSMAATNEITSITESLEKMRLSLQEAQYQKNKFIMGISHDLRTPVAVIKGYTEALTDGVITDPDEIKNTLELISVKTNQLEDMINTLINFMKLNTTDIRNTLIPHNISSLLNDFAKDAKVSGQVFNRNIECDINVDKTIETPFDTQLITRAFENIFSNALRYTKDNDTIKLIGKNDDQNVYFSISDTGCGIDKKDLSNIFDLFYRGTTSRREEGMGVGLSVVKNIIDTHGWSINVTSEKNKGSTFNITIPYKTVSKKLRN